jgi:hypothetical protein
LKCLDAWWAKCRAVSDLRYPQIWEVTLEVTGHRKSELVGFLIGIGIALLLLTGITALAWLY